MFTVKVFRNIGTVAKKSLGIRCSLTRTRARLFTNRAFTGDDFSVPPISSASIRSTFPGGSANGEFNLPESLDTVIVKGKGCEIIDSKKHTFIDFSMGWGSNLIGHANEHIISAVKQVCENGSNFAYINEEAYKLGHRIKSISPCIDMLRYCASGTEATMYCIQIARAYANLKRNLAHGHRNKILKFEGAYHGSNPTGISSLFKDPNRFDQMPYAMPDSFTSTRGLMSDEMDNNTLVAPFNDIDITKSIIEKNKNNIAAVIVDPLHKCMPPKRGFLKQLRSLCDDDGIVLIFDEVVTGFRLSLGGAQEYYGIKPDLVAYGKALGGGYPIGVFGGRQELMELCDQSRMKSIYHGEYPFVWTASSLGGNAVSCAAANKTLDILSETSLDQHIEQMHCADDQIHKLGFDMYNREKAQNDSSNNGNGGSNEYKNRYSGKDSESNVLPCYQYLHKIGTRFRHGLRDCIHDICSIDNIQVTGDGPLAQLLFTNKETDNYREAKKHENEDLRRRVMLGLFEKKIFLNPIGTKFYLSLMHEQKHLEYFYDALIAVLKKETRK